MTNTEAQQIIANLIFILDGTLSDVELEALVMAGEALDEEEWIPVEEDLPEFNKFVIVCEDDGEVLCGRYTKYKEWQEMNENHFAVNVTHWKNLPKGPEVD